jgi:hypothetical protein
MMKMMSSVMFCTKITVAAFVVLIALAAPWHARAETDVCEGNGYRLQIGDGFQVQRKDAEFCTYRSGDDAVIVLMDWPGLSRETIEAFIDDGYRTGKITLTKHGELRQISTAGGTSYLANVAGIFRNKPIEGVAGGFVGENGQGVAVLISSVADKWAEFEKQANAIIKSIEFTDLEPRVDALEWRRMLSGAGLSYREISESGDVRKDYFFCSDGRFHSSTKRSEHAGGDGATMFGFSTSRNSGDWDVKAVQGSPQIVLYYSNGRESRAGIEDRDGEIWIDGKRYNVIENSRCR